MKKYLLTVMAVAGLVSCSNETDSFNTVDPNEIRVAAQTIDASTKAPLSSTATNFQAMVLTTQTAGNYTTLYAPNAGKYMKFAEQSGNTDYGFIDADGTDNKQYYPSSTASNQNVIVSGLMPAATSTLGESAADVWKYDAGNLSITFDGNDDVMIAKEVTASKNNNADLVFNHLLTQLVVKVKVTGSADPWGDVTNIVLKKVGGNTDGDKIYNQFAITGRELTSGTATVSKTTEAGEDAVKFYKASSTGSTTTFTEDVYKGANTKLSATATTVAYTLCQAFDVAESATDDVDLVLDVYTTKYASTPKTVEIDLKPTTGSLSSTAGYSFEITLDFQTNEIMASAKIVDWKEGGNGTGTID